MNKTSRIMIAINTHKPAADCGPHCQRLDETSASAMHELEKACFAQPWSLEQCSLALRNSSFLALGLWRDTALLAYVSAYHIAEELEILNIGVTPQERRRGHGRMLLRHLLQLAGNMGTQKAILEVRESNFAAISLYKSAGFKQNGIRKHYYEDNGENALLFCLSPLEACAP